ncbi:hypothetical protein, partial [Streptomyces sp. NPDC001811]
MKGPDGVQEDLSHLHRFLIHIHSMRRAAATRIRMSGHAADPPSGLCEAPLAMSVVSRVFMVLRQEVPASRSRTATP